MVSDRMKYGILPTIAILIAGSFGIYKLGKYLQHENHNRKPEFCLQRYPQGCECPENNMPPGIALNCRNWRNYKLIAL
ncbi:MAG: hypothetical protein HY513_03115 [Candidatus Aenigmarchaeota archaeon]|nr:hypothetical protein [Candidatus Aenigmarchaeota archaeon]